MSNKIVFTAEQEKKIREHVDKRFPQESPAKENYEQAYRKAILTIQLSNEEKKN